MVASIHVKPPEIDMNSVWTESCSVPKYFSSLMMLSACGNSEKQEATTGWRPSLRTEQEATSKKGVLKAKHDVPRAPTAARGFWTEPCQRAWRAMRRHSTIRCETAEGWMHRLLKISTCANSSVDPTCTWAFSGRSPGWLSDFPLQPRVFRSQ